MFNPLCHNFIQPFCSVFSNPTTSHSMQDIALRLFSHFLQNDMCYIKAELSLPPAFVQEAMQSRHSRFISIYRIESDRENLNEALWRYVAICGDMWRYGTTSCCYLLLGRPRLPFGHPTRPTHQKVARSQPWQGLQQGESPLLSFTEVQTWYFYILL